MADRVQEQQPTPFSLPFVTHLWSLRSVSVAADNLAAVQLSLNSPDAALREQRDMR